MNTPITLETDEISCAQQDEFVVLSLKVGAFNVLTNLAAKQKLLDLMSDIDEAPDIRGLVLINSDEYPGDERYRSFLRQVMGGGLGSTYTSGTMVARIRHAIDQLTLQAVRFSKPMVAGIQGRITGEFFATVLPYDFRFAARDTMLMFPSVNLGFPPSGALAYYLERFVGLAKATEILMSGQELTATDTDALGLVTAVVDQGNLLERCLEELITVCRAPAPVLSATRHLLQPEMTEIEAYLNRAFVTNWSALFRMGKVDQG